MFLKNKIMENNISTNQENTKENFANLEGLKNKVLKSDDSKFNKQKLLKSIEDKKRALNNTVEK